MKILMSLVKLDLKKMKALLFTLKINFVNVNSAKFGIMNILLRFRSKAGMLKDGELTAEVAIFRFDKYNKRFSKNGSQMLNVLKPLKFLVQ